MHVLEAFYDDRAQQALLRGESPPEGLEDPIFEILGGRPDRPRGGAILGGFLSHPGSSKNLLRFIQNPKIRALLERQRVKGGKGLGRDLAQPILDRLHLNVIGTIDLHSGSYPAIPWPRRRTTVMHMFLKYYAEDFVRAKNAKHLESKKDLTEEEECELQFRRTVLMDVVKASQALYLKGAKVIGFGGFTSIVNPFQAVRDGLPQDERGQCPVLLTSGSYGTAVSLCQVVLKACEDVGLDMTEARLVIVGASGSICRILNEQVVDKFKTTYLLGRTKDRVDNVKKVLLERLGINSDRIQTEGSDSLNQEIAKADVVVFATNEADAENLQVNPHCFKPGTLVFDASVPSNVTDEVRALSHILVIQAGTLALPRRSAMSASATRLLGMGSQQQVYACLGELCMWALLGKWGSIQKFWRKLHPDMLAKEDIVGDEDDPKLLTQILYNHRMYGCVQNQLKKFGFKLDAYRTSDYQIVPDSRLGEMRQLILARKSTQQPELQPRLLPGY